MTIPLPAWLSDNPFLMLDLRRWLAKSRFLFLPLLGLGLASIPIVIVFIVQRFIPPPWIIGGQEASTIFMASGVSWMHLLFIGIAWRDSTNLMTEALQERVEFIQLIPRSRLQMLFELGVSRAALRSLLLLIPLPIYVWLAGYGGLEMGDVWGLLFLFGAWMFAPPAFSEIWASQTAQSGQPAAEAAQAQKKKGGNWGWMVWIGFQFFGNSLLRPVLFPLMRWVYTQSRAVLGGGLGGLFPLTALLAFSRLLWTPQDFFRWGLAPLALLLPWWLLKTAGGLLVTADLWSREPSQIMLPGGKSLWVMRRTPAHPAQWRLGRVLQNLAGFLLLLTIVGLFWQPFVLSGALSAVVASTTPTAGLAALWAMTGAIGLIVLLERIRTQTRLSEEFREPARELALDGLYVQLRIALLIALASLAGWLLPWPEPALVGLHLALALPAVLLYGVGWRRFGRQWAGSLEESEQISRLSFKLTVGGLLWISSYALPLAAMVWRPDLWLHYAAAISPVYGLLALMPGLWRSGFMLPPALALAISGGAGLLILLPALRARRKALRVKQAREEKPEPDPALEWLKARLSHLETPYSLLAFHRMARSGSLTGALILSVGGMVMVFVLILSGLAYLGASTGTALSSFFQGGGSWSIAAMIGAAMLVVSGLALAFLPLGISTSISMENLFGRFQGRLSQVLSSGASDFDLVAGSLIATGLRIAPAYAAFLTAGLLGAVMGAAGGIPFYWPLVWSIAALSAPGWCIAIGATAFYSWWRRESWWGRLLNGLLGGWPALMVILGPVIAAPLLVFLGAHRWRVDLALPWIIALFFLPGWPLARLCFNQGLHAVHKARREENLERTAQLPQQGGQMAGRRLG